MRRTEDETGTQGRHTTGTSPERRNSRSGTPNLSVADSDETVVPSIATGSSEGGGPSTADRKPRNKSREREVLGAARRAYSRDGPKKPLMIDERLKRPEGTKCEAVDVTSEISGL